MRVTQRSTANSFKILMWRTPLYSYIMIQVIPEEFIENWKVQLTDTKPNFPTWGFQPRYSLIRGLVKLYRWWWVNVGMTMEPCAINNLVLFTVLSYDVTVDSVVHYCHLVEVGGISVGGSSGHPSYRWRENGDVKIYYWLVTRSDPCLIR